MIPVVGLQQMCIVGIFLQDGRSAGCILHPTLIAVITAETGRCIVIATIAEIIHLQGVTTHEDTAAPLHSCPDVTGTGVAGQPEAVEVAQAVALFPLILHTGIIFHRLAFVESFFAPQGQTFGRQDLARIAIKRHLVVRSLRLHTPIFLELPAVQCRLSLYHHAQQGKGQTKHLSHALFEFGIPFCCEGQIFAQR